MADLVECYYSVQHLCWRLGFSETFIRRTIKSGGFSPCGDLSNIVQTADGDLRVPASGVLFWLSNNKLGPAAGGAVKARTPGELRRKLDQFSE